MANTVLTTPYFERRYKRFKKKFATLDEEYAALINQLEASPESGTGLGSGLYKVRMASASKGHGKSGGFRVITYLKRNTGDGTEIILITIYDKSEESTVGKAELEKLVKKYVGD